MARRRLLLLLPLLILTALTGWTLMAPTLTRSSEKRIASPALAALERKLGRHLYAPCWLPYGGHVGASDALLGRHRVIQDFDTPDGRVLALLAQEARSPGRDRYHDQIFRKKAEVRSEVNGKPAYLVTGSNGERRLFWNENDTALILSSTWLTDEELVRIAQTVK